MRQNTLIIDFEMEPSTATPSSKMALDYCSAFWFLFCKSLPISRRLSHAGPLRDQVRNALDLQKLHLAEKQQHLQDTMKYFIPIKIRQAIWSN